MMNISTPRSRRSGFTLIEVAIALAIFVFGALAIVQIFPPALGVIRNNEGRIAGMQLGETMLARATGKSNWVPDAIYEGDAAGVWQDTPLAMVGTPTRNGSLPNGLESTNFDASALGRFKFIKGERHTVRVYGGDEFVLLNHPYASAVKVYRDVDVDGVRIGEDGILDFTYATMPRSALRSTLALNEKAVEFNDGPTVNARSNQSLSINLPITYYVSYRWTDGTNIHGVIDEPITLPINAIWGGDQAKVAQRLIDSSNYRIAPGRVEVRCRIELGTIPLIADDASRGFVAIDDSTWSLSTVVPTPYQIPPVAAGETLSFDYLVSDWRTLVDDDNASMASGTVQLPIKNLDEFPVVGVQTTIGDTASPLPLIPVVNYKNGTVTYPSIAGKRYRTIYRALDGWAQQLSVAAKSYIPYYEDADFAAASAPGSRPLTLLPREPWREYSWNVSDRSKIYFHASEAGKSVVVSLGYIESGVFKMKDNIVLTLDNIQAIPGSVPATYAPSNRVAAATIPDTIVNPANIVSILSIQGLSVQARTAWQNADRYNQVIVPAYRTLVQ